MVLAASGPDLLFAVPAIGAFSLIVPGGIIQDRIGSRSGAAVPIAASLGFSFYTRGAGDYGATCGSIGAAIILVILMSSRPCMAGLAIRVGSNIDVLLKCSSTKSTKGGRSGAGAHHGGPRLPERLSR